MRFIQALQDDEPHYGEYFSKHSILRMIEQYNEKDDLFSNSWQPQEETIQFYVECEDTNQSLQYKASVGQLPVHTCSRTMISSVNDIGMLLSSHSLTTIDQLYKIMELKLLGHPTSTVGEPETINNKLKLVLASDMSNSTVESMIPVTVPHSIDSEDVSNDFQVKHEVPTVNIVTPDDKINSEKENDKEEHSNQIRFDTTQISIVSPCYSPQEIYENDWEEETNFTDTWECIYMDWLEEESYNSNINSDEVEIIFETYQDSPPPQIKPPELGNNKIPLFPSNVITPQSLKSNIKMVDLTTEEMITFITTPRSYSKSSNVSQ